MKKLLLLALLASPVMAMATVKTFKAPALGCVEKEQVTDFLHLFNQGDKYAMRKFIMQQVALGNCDGFDNGEKVNLEDVSFSGLTQIRRNGDVKKYWVIRDFLVN